MSCNPTSIVAGPDGNLYFNCSSSLGQITTSGAARTFPNSFGITYLAEGIVKGPDGNPWFADTNGVFIGEFNPSNESFTNYVPPYSGGTVYNLALGGTTTCGPRSRTTKSMSTSSTP